MFSELSSNDVGGTNDSYSYSQKGYSVPQNQVLLFSLPETKMFQCNSTSVEMVGPRICRCQIADISIHCLKQMAPYIDCLAVKSKIQIKCSSFFFFNVLTPPLQKKREQQVALLSPTVNPALPLPERISLWKVKNLEDSFAYCSSVDSFCLHG